MPYATPEQPSNQGLTFAQAMNNAHAHWNAGQAAQAEQLCLRILEKWPGEPHASHLLGLMAHAYGKLDMAISYIETACKVADAPPLFSANLAEMYRQKGALVQAEAAARRAVTRDPALVGGWMNLGIVLQEMGKFEDSRECLERVASLEPNNAQVHNNLANTHRRLGRFDLAETHYRQALALNPDYAQAHSNLCFLLSTQGRYDEAAAEARLAIELEPQFADAYVNLAEVEASRHRYDAALQALDMLSGFAPRHPAGVLARAKALRQIERLDEALVCARDAVELQPQNADTHQTLAAVLQAQGLTDDALRAYEQAMALPGTASESAMLGQASLLQEAGKLDASREAYDRLLTMYPGSIAARIGRAELHKFTADDPDIAPLEAFVAEGDVRSLTDRIGARFALSKAYMDIRDASRAFTHLDEGNRLKRASFEYDSAQTGRWMARVAETFSAQRYQGIADMAALTQAGDPATLPVFVIGMPRSGTTLIEQILSSHPMVTGAGELAALRRTVDKRGAFPDMVSALTDEMLLDMGRDYLAMVEPLAHGNARLVDKMPANFLYAGLIPLILPGARIIHARRDPVDTCLSCYTKLFSGEQRFTYNQRELGEFYRYYDALMAHLRTVLPADRFIEVEYESVVDQLEVEARRMIDFIGLPWDDACLSFHTNSRVVRTASVSQVRKPIYKTSKGRWLPYAAQLAPLLDALGITPPAADNTTSS